MSLLWDAMHKWVNSIQINPKHNEKQKAKCATTDEDGHKQRMILSTLFALVCLSVRFHTGVHPLPVIGIFVESSSAYSVVSDLMYFLR